MSDKENMVILSNGSYLVRTQAGFKKAIKHWVEDYWYFPDDNFNYPKSYPSVVDFYHYYKGSHVYNCNCIHLNKYKEKLTKLLKEIENA